MNAETIFSHSAAAARLFLHQESKPCLLQTELDRSNGFKSSFIQSLPCSIEENEERNKERKTKRESLSPASTVVGISMTTTQLSGPDSKPLTIETSNLNEDEKALLKFLSDNQICLPLNGGHDADKSPKAPSLVRAASAVTSADAKPAVGATPTAVLLPPTVPPQHLPVAAAPLAVLLQQQLQQQQLGANPVMLLLNQQQQPMQRQLNPVLVRTATGHQLVYPSSSLTIPSVTGVSAAASNQLYPSFVDASRLLSSLKS